jgi:hypothetical protein
VWGALGLYREQGRPMFSEFEKSFVARLAPVLADGARRACYSARRQIPSMPTRRVCSC